jgi:hypothetical protein
MDASGNFRPIPHWITEGFARNRNTSENINNNNSNVNRNLYGEALDSETDTDDTLVPNYPNDTESSYENVSTWDDLHYRNELDHTDACGDCDTQVHTFPSSQSADIANLLVHENMDVLRRFLHGDEHSVEEIEMLLTDILDNQCENPNLSKCELVGCLCPGVCKPMQITPSPKIVQDACKFGCECDVCTDDCSICLMPFGSGDSIKTSCNHRFHEKCWLKVPHSVSDDWVPCPLCRTRASLWTYKNAKSAFLRTVQCTCCEHHQSRRPTEFFSDAPFVENFKRCSDPRAIVLRELLWRKRERTPTCHCECRGISRRMCRMISVEL